MPAGVYTRKPLDVRFWAKVKKTRGCWIWTGSKLPKGYGQIGNGKARGPLKAHRVSYELNIGPIPPRLLVCHSCDNPSCVNPAHLWLGTHKQNIDDMRAKGREKKRGAVGTRNGKAKLTDQKVRVIRRSKLHSKVLAKIYGVSIGAIQRARYGHQWRHV